MSTVTLAPGTAVTVALLCLTNLLSSIDRTLLSILLPPIREELALSDTQLGLLTGIAFAAFYAVAGIPVARLADRISRRAVIAASVAAWSAMTAVTGAASNFLQMFLARAGTAIGEAGAVPPAHSMISDLFPAERRAGVLALHSAAAPLGTLVGLAVGGWLATLVGWRMTFVAFGLPGLALAALVWRFAGEPSRGRFDAQSGTPGRMDFVATIQKLISNRAFLYLLVAFAIGTFVVTGLVQWLPSFFVRQFDASTAEVGLYYGLAFGGGSILGMVGGARFANRMITRDMRWSMWLACISYAVVFPLYLTMLWLPDLLGAIVLVALASVVAGIAYGPVWAAIQNLTPPQMRAMAAAVSLLAANLVGGGLGPLMVGVVSDLAPFSGEADRLRFGLAVAVCMTPIPIFFFWMSSRHVSSRPVAV